MRDIIDCMDEINMDIFEYAILVEDTSHSAQKFKMYIPKIMGGIKVQFARSWVEKVDDKIFINDAKCKITAAKSVNCQNYLTLNRHFDTNFAYRADSKGKIKQGTRFMVHSMYGNPKDVRVDRVM